ncbi:MAG: hypothetical protein ACK4MM_07350, partial [Fervidobacterium sp.]
QARKISACHLPAHRTIVRRNKIPLLEELYREYQPEKLVVIDDDSTVLDKAPDEAVKIRIGETGENSFKGIYEAAEHVHEILKR